MPEVTFHNTIARKQRIIIHNNEALSLVSFSESNPKKITDWRRQGDKPILWDPQAWRIIEKLEWKLILNDDNSVRSVIAKKLE